MVSLLLTALKPLSANLVKSIRKKACGFAGIDPMVCCSQEIRPRTLRRVSTEKPWVWDIDQRNDITPLLQKSNTHNFEWPKYSKNKRKKADFENFDSFRNDPGRLSNDFSLMQTHYEEPIPFDNVIPNMLSASNDFNFISNYESVGLNLPNCGISTSSRFVDKVDGAFSGLFPWFTIYS